jgi:hypothetical protein
MHIITNWCGEKICNRSEDEGTPSLQISSDEVWQYRDMKKR